MLMTRALGRMRSRGSAAWVMLRQVSAFMENMRDQLSTVPSAIISHVKPPATFTRMSGGPIVSTIASTPVCPKLGNRAVEHSAREGIARDAFALVLDRIGDDFQGLPLFTKTILVRSPLLPKCTLSKPVCSFRASTLKG